MIYDGNLIKIDGTTLPYVSSYKVSRAKLWKDAERNMNGDVRATFIGIFPKIVMQIRPTTQEEMSALTRLLDKDYFVVEYFDVRAQEMVRADYYASDYDTELKIKRKGIYEAFEVSLVPVSKRRY